MMTFLEELFANKVMMLAMDYVSKPVTPGEARLL